MHAERSIALCVGEALFDDIALRDEQERPGASPRLLAGGAPANTAVALRKLGVNSAFAGCIAEDAAGENLMKLLQEANIDVRGVQRTREAPTRIVRVRCDAHGERRFLDFGGGAPDAFADALFKAENLPPTLLANVGIVVVGALSQAYPTSREAIQHIIRDARTEDIPVLVDVNRRPMFWPDADDREEYERTHALVEQASLLKATREEADWLFQTHDPDEIADIAPQLQAGIVVTDGPRTIAFHIGGVSGKLLPPKIAAVDTTGAGDAFTAGWVARHLFHRRVTHAGASATETIRYASIVGALATAGVGAWNTLPTHDDVSAFLAKHDLPTHHA